MTILSFLASVFMAIVFAIICAIILVGIKVVPEFLKATLRTTSASKLPFGPLSERKACEAVQKRKNDLEKESREYIKDGYSYHFFLSGFMPYLLVSVYFTDGRGEKMCYRMFYEGYIQKGDKYFLDRHANKNGPNWF